jgi:hypothetical protein
MASRSGRPAAKTPLDIVVGIEAGVIGSVVMLVWFALISPVLGEAWWLMPNLFASGFYDERLVLSGTGIATLAGCALQLTAGGLVGAVNALLTPGGRLFGLAVAAAWYVLCYFFLWKRIAPGLFAYGSQTVILVGYFLYGSVLGWQNDLAARARR